MKKQKSNNKQFWLIIIIFAGIFIIFFFKQKQVAKIKLQNVTETLRSEARKHDVFFDSVVLTKDNDLKATIGNNLTILFLTKKTYAKDLISLQKILKSTTIDREIKEIDFRFNKIIIR